MPYELIAAAAGLGLGAWFVGHGDASDRARLWVALALLTAVLLRLLFGAVLASNLLFIAIAIGVLLHRQYQRGR